MKNCLVSIFVICALPSITDLPKVAPTTSAHITQNVIIVTIDGFRWQEIFTGADSALLNDEEYTADRSTLNAIYWDSSATERREKLMPFFWQVIALQGQLYGNRHFDNKVNAANDYGISYPGYNEIFTGNTDVFISSNRKYNNPNINVLEWLNQKGDLKENIAAFTSWDVFPYILNENRSTILVNSGYEAIQTESNTAKHVNYLQNHLADKEATRQDALTFIAAKNYIQQQRPRLFYLGLGETDEFAHDGRYDLYLQQANATDGMIASLWHWVQTTAGYKDNTTLIITTDHGRGKKKNKWMSHGAWVAGSSEAWLAVIGPDIEPLGEMKGEQQIYLQQLAATIAGFFGEKFEPGHPVAEAITFPVKNKTPSTGGVLVATIAEKKII